MKNYLTLQKPVNISETINTYKENELVYYYPMEELFNSLTHSFGVLFGFIMLAFMLIKATTAASYATAVLSCVSFIIMFACSASYHGVPTIKAKRILRRVDYSAINLTVIACGTGACLLYGNTYGYVAYGICYAISIVIMFLCMRYFGVFRYVAIVSNFINGGFLTVAYVLSAHYIPSIATQFCIAGLILCLIGAVMFGIKIRFAHTVFHLLVLFGPICFMFSNYFQIV